MPAYPRLREDNADVRERVPASRRWYRYLGGFGGAAIGTGVMYTVLPWRDHVHGVVGAVNLAAGVMCVAASLLLQRRQARR